jgi:uncharacterized HAD superfamily protein
MNSLLEKKLTKIQCVTPDNTGFDIDSVFGDLSEVLVRIAREIYGINIKEEDFTDFYLEKCLPFGESFIQEWVSLALSEYWTLQMKPMEGSVELLTEIGQTRKLHFITARKDDELIRKWVFRQLPDVPRENICIRAVGNFDGKVRVLKELGLSCFIEDRGETCELLYNNGILPIIYHQPWNEKWKAFPRVKDWKDIRSLFEKGSVYP